MLLNSYTTTIEHSYEISSGIIQLTEGRMPEDNSPVPKLIDMSLGLITVIYLILGIRGVKGSKDWANRRMKYPAGIYYLRLLPQVIPSLFIGWLFFIVPNLQNNSSTIKDAFGLWMALMVLLTIVFLIGVLITAMRIYYRIKLNNIQKSFILK